MGGGGGNGQKSARILLFVPTLLTTIVVPKVPPLIDVSLKSKIVFFAPVLL